MATLADDARDGAFERLYEGHAREVYRYALAVLRNPADAEDVTQTTFLNAYRAFKAGERPRKPLNWLLTIAHNACRTRVRLRSRRPREVPLDESVERIVVPEHEKPNLRELLRALGRLPFNQRAALTMRELEGRSYAEIAETLGCSVSAVEALLARARRTLRLHRAALRGLASVELPRSLAALFETGDATGAGGLVGGGGTLARLAAAVAAAVVAGGVGYKAVEAGVVHHRGPSAAGPRAHAARAATPRLHAAAAAVVAPPARARPAHRPPAHVRPLRIAPPPAPAAAVVRAPSPRRPAHPPAPAAPAVPAPPAAPQAGRRFRASTPPSPLPAVVTAPAVPAPPLPTVPPLPTAPPLPAVSVPSLPQPPLPQPPPPPQAPTRLP